MNQEICKLDLNQKFGLFSETWSPKIVAELNGQYLKLAKFQGELPWHSHEHEDEYFQVIKGKITIHLRDQSIHLSAGEGLVVPKGVEHQPAAEAEAWVMIFEPKATKHLGEAKHDCSIEVSDQEWI